jgi:hypothetical protein
MRTARVFSKVDGHVERIFVHAQFYRAFTQMLTTGSTICVTRGSAMEQRLRTCGFSRGGSGSQHPPTAASRC